MKRALFLALAAALAVAMPTASGADKVTTTPVQFAKGTSSFSTTHSLQGYDSVNYTLAAKAGQSMRISLTGNSNVGFNIYAPDDIPALPRLLAVAARGRTGTAYCPPPEPIPCRCIRCVRRPAAAAARPMRSASRFTDGIPAGACHGNAGVITRVE